MQGEKGREIGFEEIAALFVALTGHPAPNHIIPRRLSHRRCCGFHAGQDAIREHQPLIQQQWPRT